VKFIFDMAAHRLGVRGVYFNIHGMRNIDSSDPRIEQFVAEQIARVSPALEQSDIIQGFSILHRRVSSRARKLVASSENLLAYFRAHGGIPRINGLVDVYNAISLNSGVAIGAHDLAHVSGDIQLRLTTGSEVYWPLGASEPGKVAAGEYGYVDSSNEILCRMEVRQVQKTRISLDSHDAFFIVQAHDVAKPDVIKRSAGELEYACLQFFGGKVERLADIRGATSNQIP
jgi:DNA/RNA-binding domain of Phe-tRNA-synthetase-like protein